ncbi:hypothetical protein ACFOEE_20075 [Pseudoalteromonas fenneropenaei]|uniref:MYM-type domain-containing protein n=1 Tax=Pseudoalteromonas fenneropenaei TaxID=1737459 RepID=A0ABV7CQ52_9GAMM
MLDLKQFNQRRAASFNQQRALLKSLSSGKTCCCEHCKAPLQLDLHSTTKQGRVYCKKGCTDILLELGA